MSDHESSTPEIDKRRVDAAALYLQGLNQFDIAKQLGVERSTISRDIKAIRQQWRETSKQLIAQWQDRELQLLDQLEAEAWEAWERSKQDAVRKKKGSTPKGAFNETLRYGQAGDPRFLEVIRNCSQRRCDIMGLDAPKKNEVSGPPSLSREKMEAEVRQRINRLTSPQTN